MVSTQNSFLNYLTNRPPVQSSSTPVLTDPSIPTSMGDAGLSWNSPQPNKPTDVSAAGMANPSSMSTSQQLGDFLQKNGSSNLQKAGGAMMKSGMMGGL